MKKAFIALMSMAILQACNNGGQSGVQNDGIKIGDTNGGLADTSYHNQSATDTSKMEHRVDLSKRDTFENQPNQ